MDKQTLSNYGWVIITVLVLAVMIALATPFGNYIKEGAKSTLTGLFESSENALNTGLNEAGVSVNKAEFGGIPTVGSNTDTEEIVVGSATFYGYYNQDEIYIEEEVTLTWDELKHEENGLRYGYNASLISDTIIKSNTFSYSSVKIIEVPNTMTAIEDNAFVCSEIECIKIPYSVTSIGRYAFYTCESLTSVTILDGVTSIGDNAFDCCYSLTSITIPNSVTSIGDEVFRECYALADVVIPNSVTSIGDQTFYCCPALTSITIPNSVTSIGDASFEGCGNLGNITFDGTKAQWNAISLGINWNYDVSATVVHCTDGDVAI